MDKEYEDVEQEFVKFEEENQSVAGKYLSMSQEVGENNANVYNIETEDGIKSIWGTTVLDQKMSLLKIGDDIKIIYLGKVKPEKGKTYHDYKIQKAKSE